MQKKEKIYSGSVKAENRRSPRVELNLNIRYAPMKKGELPRPHQSLAADLGAGGMAMTSSQAWPEGHLLTVNLYLPPLKACLTPEGERPLFCEQDCEPVTLLTRVVWCRPEAKGRYKIGLAFFDTDRANKKRLKHFLVAYELDEHPDDGR